MQYLLTTPAVPTSPRSPTKANGPNLLEVTAVNRWKRQVSLPEENDLVHDNADSPFDTTSLYSSPSMLSIHSAVGTSKYEEETFQVIFINNSHPQTNMCMHGY